MFNRNILLSVIILVAVLSVWWFALPFNERAVVPLDAELSSLQEARDRYTQLDLSALKRKVASLDALQARMLDSYVPRQLHSGRLVYTIAQLAQQNRLNIKGIQYSVVDVQGQVGKKLAMEFQVEGFYENMVAWVHGVELSDVLVDIEDVKAAKISNMNDIISLTVKMSAYGIQID